LFCSMYLFLVSRGSWSNEFFFVQNNRTLSRLVFYLFTIIALPFSFYFTNLFYFSHDCLDLSNYLFLLHFDNNLVVNSSM
jgi:hypothetical protein